MGILNRPSDGLLSAFIALRRAISAFGPVTEDRLLALCAPPSIVDQDERMARKTLVRWQQLGFFENVDGRVEIARAYRRLPMDDLAALRAALLRLVLAPANNPTLANPTPLDEDSSRAADFSRAAAWMLSQDPYTFRTSWEEVDSLQNVQGADPRVFTNGTRWYGLAEWGTFLGVAWPAPSGTGVVPNPAFAIGVFLEDVFDGARELPQEVFFTRLVEALPVLDGGSYWQNAVTSIPGVPRRKRENHVSQALSLGILQLDAADTIRLESRADAPYRLLVGRGGRELRRVSHVTLLSRQ